MFALCSFSVSSLSEKRFVTFKVVDALIYKGLQPRTPVVRRWEAWKSVIGYLAFALEVNNRQRLHWGSDRSAPYTEN
jgi:hypothetical protein